MAGLPPQVLAEGPRPDPDVASWWFPFLLLGIGTALLHQLAATGGSMRALGYASLFGAASLTVKAARGIQRPQGRPVDH